MWVEVDNLHLVALGAPSPPEEAVAVGAAHDCHEAVVGGVLALSGGEVDMEREPAVSVGEDAVGLHWVGCEIDRVARGGRGGVDGLHILWPQPEVLDEFGVGEVELLQL